MIRGLVLLSLVSGCAADCADRDWRSRGERDGYGGHPPQDLRLAGTCAGFSPSAYLEGWRVGHDEHDRLKTMNDF